MRFKRIKHLHFVGIGGTGMCGIAEVLHNSGYKITGSDLKKTETTEHLESLGIRIDYSHEASNMKGADVVVTSSAVGDDNPEVMAARAEKTPVIRRAEMLSELMRMKFSIAVAGTHGKTTTTSLIGHILRAGGFDPTVIVGGRVLGVGSNAYLGKGDYLVAEADEYDRSITKFFATIAVLTNIEAEHMECYADIDDLHNCFAQFANRVPFYGSAILCPDDPGIRAIESQITRPVITYGLSAEADFSARNISFSESGIKFTLVQKGVEDGIVVSPLFGYHNVRNILAGLAVAYDLETPVKKAIEAVKSFSGVGRRLELAGEVAGIRFYDDYGHHPTEISTTLQGLRNVFPGRIVAVFQPHLYSRTKRFYEDFGRAFFDADVLVVLDVFPSRERPINGVSGKMVADSARDQGHKNVRYVEDKNALPDFMTGHLKAGDRVILFGAGDINRLTQRIIEKLRAS
jgi:UDP-N-acetylmuramate--alanine ligase